MNKTTAAVTLTMPDATTHTVTNKEDGQTPSRCNQRARPPSVAYSRERLDPVPETRLVSRLQLCEIQ